MEQRAGHFMPSLLWQSQLDTLEKPQNDWIFNIQNDSKQCIYKFYKKKKIKIKNYCKNSAIQKNP